MDWYAPPGGRAKIARPKRVKLCIYFFTHPKANQALVRQVEKCNDDDEQTSNFSHHKGDLTPVPKKRGKWKINTAMMIMMMMATINTHKKKFSTVLREEESSENSQNAGNVSILRGKMEPKAFPLRSGVASVELKFSPNSHLVTEGKMNWRRKSFPERALKSGNLTVWST